MKRQTLLLFVLVTAACSTPSTKPTEVAVAEGAEISEADNSVGELEITSETVTFPSGDLVLAGTLVRPASSGKWPAAVILHDWGMRGRDGVVGEVFGVRLPTEVAVYRALAESLATRGVAVLIFDKRNCARESEPWCTYPPEWATARADLGDALAEDAVAAAAWLRARADVSEVAFIGHGHGAEIALTSATAAAASSVVLLAPPADGLEVRARFQLEESIRLIDLRVAEVGDVPEADLLKTRRGELEAQLAAKPNVLGFAPATLTNLDGLHARYVAAAASPSAELLVIAADVDPGEPPNTGARLASMFGDAMVLLPDLSRAMVSLGEDGDPSVVSADVVIRIAEFLRGATEP